MTAATSLDEMLKFDEPFNRNFVEFLAGQTQPTIQGIECAGAHVWVVDNRSLRPYLIDATTGKLAKEGDDPNQADPDIRRKINEVREIWRRPFPNFSHVTSNSNNVFVGDRSARVILMYDLEGIFLGLHEPRTNVFGDTSIDETFNVDNLDVIFRKGFSAANGNITHFRTPNGNYAYDMIARDSIDGAIYGLNLIKEPREDEAILGPNVITANLYKLSPQDKGLFGKIKRKKIQLNNPAPYQITNIAFTQDYLIVVCLDNREFHRGYKVQLYRRANGGFNFEKEIGCAESLPLVTTMKPNILIACDGANLRRYEIK